MDDIDLISANMENALASIGGFSAVDDRSLLIIRYDYKTITDLHHCAYFLKTF